VAKSYIRGYHGTYSNIIYLFIDDQSQGENTKTKNNSSHVPWKLTWNIYPRVSARDR
jgi:hypothetical protein